ncbi:MAG: hypothetical protein ABW321_05175, partial [Polyangiales bacterium]
MGRLAGIARGVQLAGIARGIQLAGIARGGIAYRDELSGTSSAGPVITIAAAVNSSIAQDRGYLMTSQEVRELLMKTG